MDTAYRGLPKYVMVRVEENIYIGVKIMVLHRVWERASNPPLGDKNKFPVGISGNIPSQK